MAAHRMTRASISLVIAGVVALAGCGHASLTKVGPVGSAPSIWANGPIVYERYAGASSDESSSQIFLRTPAGAIRQLTRVQGGAFAPAWSPSGTRIAFERGASAGRHLIFSMNPDGTDLRPLARGCTAASRCVLDAFPAYSPDGRHVSFERVYGPIVHRTDPGSGGPVDYAARVDLMVVDARGGAPRAIARWGTDPQPWDGAPRWAPDGTRLVLPLGTFRHHNKHTILGTALVVLDASGGTQRRITSWDLGAGNPDWSPDGRQIVFNSEGGHSRSTYVVRPDGRGLRRLLAGGAALSHLGDTVAPAWSPDGKQIVFTTEPRRCGSLHINACRDVAYTFDVYVMNADGTHLRDITSAPQFEARPAWGATQG
jgi:Tol biopolymer transport system component